MGYQMKHLKHCKGCATYISEDLDYVLCSRSSDNEDGNCPCSKCIVKSMCEEVCPPFNRWVYILDKDFVFYKK